MPQVKIFQGSFRTVQDAANHWVVEQGDNIEIIETKMTGVGETASITLVIWYEDMRT